jgi:CHAT domain-containing protein/tetratricopeptide (TPR) repeat protein
MKTLASGMMSKREDDLVAEPNKQRCGLTGLLLALVLAIWGMPVPASAQRGDPDAIFQRIHELTVAGDDDAAIVEAQRFEAVIKARYGINHPNYEKALNVIAVMYEKAGRYGEAAELHTRVLALREKRKEPRSTDIAETLNNLAVVYWKQGKYDKAEGLYKRALEVNEKTPNRTDKFGIPNLEGTIINLAVLYRSEGRYAEAEGLYKRSLAIREKAFGKDDSPDTAVTLGELVRVYRNQGRYDEAEELAKRALAIKERTQLVTSPNNVAMATSNLAQVYLAQSRYADAEGLFKRALAMQEQIHGKSNTYVADNVDDLALVYQGQGRYDEAEGLFKRALAIHEQVEGPSHPAVAETLNQLAILYGATGSTRDALIFSRRATAAVTAHAGVEAAGVRQNDKTGDLVEGRANYFLRLVTNIAAAAQKGIESAPALSREALETAQLAVASSAAAAIQQMGLRIAGGGDLMGSLIRESQDLSVFLRERDQALIEALSKLEGQRNQARIDNIRKQIADTERRLVTIAAQLEKDFPEYTALASPKPLKAEEVQQLLRPDEALVFFLAADKESYVFALTSDGFDWKTIPVGGEAVSQKVAAFRRGLEVDAVSRGLTRLECNEGEAKKRGLSRTECGDAVARDCAQASAERGLARFGCIVPVAHVECSEAEATARGLMRPQCGENVLKDCAQGDAEQRGLMRADCDAILAGRHDLFDLGRAYELYQTLLGPVDGLIKGKRHLLIVPSGALTALPFHLLVTEKPTMATPQLEDTVTAATFAPYREAAWLVRRQAVTVLPSVASLKALRVFARKDQATKPMVGFGDPVFSPEAERGAAGTRTAQARGVTRSYTAFWKGVSIDRGELANALPRLPDTADELKKVASALGAGADDIYLREAASENTVKRIALSDYRVVYFATHGLVAGEVKGLAEPSLALTLPRQASNADDGLLTASEIAQLKLNADWVVLSACNTVAGDKPGAEALSGLARAFFYAGARALLVSHWAVESRAATRLTTATFDLLRADPKLGRAEALRRAMLAYLADTSTPMNAYPALWAPFEIVGEGAVR